MNQAAVRLRSVTRSYGKGASAVTALDNVSLDIPRGTFTAVMGPSGSGQSTFLQCTAGLDRPTGGQVLLGETDLSKLSEKKLTLLRRDRIGFVFQAFNLLPSLTAEQNVALPLRLAGRGPKRNDVLDVLEKVGLRERAGHRPSELSGGTARVVRAARPAGRTGGHARVSARYRAGDRGGGRGDRRPVLGGPAARAAADLARPAGHVHHRPPPAPGPAGESLSLMTFSLSWSLMAAVSPTTRSGPAAEPVDRISSSG
ncbi:ABC transporter ATP-binding protein [Streptomyces sp. NPDC088755]|uniref:ABC transporter ATP-binding protein n=1 Tax=Streptomyces sp. NPDC088755 TaxID=3365888 RepID=UPI0038203C20